MRTVLFAKALFVLGVAMSFSAVWGGELPARSHHPLGLIIRYPLNWKVSEVAGGFQLFPDHSGSSPMFPEKFYLLLLSAAESRLPARGELRPFSTDFVEGERALPASQLLLRHGGEKPDAWYQTLADSQKASLRWTLRVRSLGHLRVGLVAIGTEARISQCLPDLIAVLNALEDGERRIHPGLVGSWVQAEIPDSSDRYCEAGLLINLMPDGQILFTDEKNARPWLSAAGPFTDGGDGLWGVSGGHLFLYPESGPSRKYAYRIAGEPRRRQLLLEKQDGHSLRWLEPFKAL